MLHRPSLIDDRPAGLAGAALSGSLRCGRLRRLQEARAGARLGALLTAGLWCAVGLVFVAATLHNGERPPVWIPVYAAVAVSGALVSALLFLVAVVTTDLRTPLRVAVLAGAVTTAAFAQSVADYQILGLGFALQPELQPPPFARAIRYNMMLYVWIYAFYVAATGLILAEQRARRNERQLLQARAAADRARLDALRLQVSPHFLFNALNAAASLVGLGRNRDAEAVLLRLSDFFRGSLSAPPGEANSLAAEFDLMAAWLAIEGVRSGGRLTAETRLPEDLGAIGVPHFLMQPLIENAVRHAVARTDRRTTVAVSAARGDRDRLLLTVAVDAAPEADGSGEGLRELRERLRILHGDAARLRTRRRDGRFIAEIDMPLARVD